MYGKEWRRNLTGYLFLSPWIIGLLIFTAIPVGASLYISFTNYDVLSAPEWVGTANYMNMLFQDSKFIDSLKVTLTYVLLGVPLELIFALTLALFLLKGIKGLHLYRAIYYVPSLIGGSVAIAILWKQVFGVNGLLNSVLSIFGIQGTSWIAHPDYALYTLILLKVWQFGSPMIIFLAGLKQIPSELYEASSIDGAGKVSRFFKITLPLLTPIVFFNMVMQIIGSFQAFTPAYIISDGKGGPMNATLFYTLYLYQKGFASLDMGYAAALAWTLLLIIAAVTAIVFLTAKRWVYYDN
jgi:multiple sugar transport system permease protein